MTGPMIVSPTPPDEEPAATRLRRSIRSEMRGRDCPEPSDEQVAVVLHALADHTAILSAMRWRHDPDSHWPEATSMARWFHGVARQFEDTP